MRLDRAWESLSNKIWEKTGFGRLGISHLEFHVSHTCNLNCRLCSHYCDIGYGQKMDHGAALASIRAWSRRIAPRKVDMLGGEPFLERRLPDYVQTCYEAFPRARRQVISNGTLLERWDDDIAALLKKTNTRLVVSLHPLPEKMRDMQDRSLRTLERWQRDHGIATAFRRYSAEETQNWVGFYQGEGVDMRPFNSMDGAAARERCGSKHYTILQDGALWQCAQLAFLPFVFDKLTHKDEWKAYLAYPPVTLSSSRRDLADFFRDRHAVDFCRMCADGQSRAGTDA